MKRALIAAVAAATLALAGAARAESPETTTDIRCLVVAGTLAQKDDPKLKNIGTVTFIYFWGRLQGRGAMDGLTERFKQEAAKMSPNDLEAQGETCGQMLIDSGKGIQDLGAAVDAPAADTAH